MPNAFDVGSARILETAGALALATTSSGHAGTLGRHDQHVGREELVAHVEAMAAAVGVPVSVDAEDCLGEDVPGVIETVERLAATDAAGFSIEDFDPRTRSIRTIEVATERVAAARAVDLDMVVTARCENLLHGVDDLDDTIARLIAYRDAGADVVYAPGLTTIDDIGRVVEAVGAPVNVLALPVAPSVPELAEAGVARVSVGGLLAWVAYGAVYRAAEELLTTGTSSYASGVLRGEVRNAAFGERQT